MTCERHGGNAGSIMCRECDLETIERDAMTKPTQWDIDRAALEKRLTDAALDLLGFMAAHEATVPIQNTNPQLVVFVGERK